MNVIDAVKKALAEARAEREQLDRLKTSPAARKRA